MYVEVRMYAAKNANMKESNVPDTSVRNSEPTIES